jgi:two-component system sensor histidine kinase AgrC
MYPEFAYSVQMQVVLAVITFAETFCSMYMLSTITIAALGLSASWKQKAIFAFITGTILHSVPVYGLYLFDSGVSFSDTILLFVIIPNPVFALIYYFIAQKIFKFSPIRKLVSYIYVFLIAVKSLGRIGASTLFIQNEAGYNYLKDVYLQISYLSVFFIIYKITMYFIRRGRISFRSVDNMFFNKNKDFFLFLVKATVAFSIRFFLPMIITEQALAHTLALITLVLFIIICICLDVIAYKNQTISNHEVHISALFKGMEELRGIKHDFNNILHTYSGYLELKEYERLERYHASLVSVTSHAGSVMELAQKMQENPAVVTLLISKLEYAESMNVNMRVSLKCELGNLYIDNMDISRVLACLLDNAIEAAHDSEQRKAYVTMESKKDSKLIIITNSTASAVEPTTIVNAGTTKTGHDGIGLSVVRRTLAKYGNCTFHMKYYDREFSVYVELKETI